MKWNGLDKGNKSNAVFYVNGQVTKIECGRRRSSGTTRLKPKSLMANGNDNNK